MESGKIMSKLAQMDILGRVGSIQGKRVAVDAIQFKIRNVNGELFFIYMNT